MNTRAAKNSQHQKISGHSAFSSALNARPDAKTHGASCESLSFSKSAIVTAQGRKRGMTPRLLEMPPAQQQQLREWLTVAGVNYAEAGKRLRERFNVSVSRDAIFRFYHEQCQDAPAAPASTETKPLVDLLIDAGGISVRIQVLAPSGATVHTRGTAP